MTNQKLDEKQALLLQAQSHEDDPILFTIIGEIGKNSHYNTTALAVTASSIFTFDFGSETASERIPFTDVDDVYTKRMYGNGLLRVKKKDGSIVDLFRFTFTVAGLCDAAIAFVQGVRGGESAESEMEAIHGAYEKLLSICPKCGRTLSAPGVPCINCMNKGKLLKKLGKYLKPQAPVLIVISECDYVKSAAVGAKLKKNDYRSMDIGIAAAYLTAEAGALPVAVPGSPFV